MNVGLLKNGQSLNGIQGTTAGVTDANGESEFTDLVVTAAGYGLGLRFSVGSVSADSYEFMILHGQPTTLTLEVEPQNGIASVALSPAPAVKLTDANGNPVPGSTVMVKEVGGAEISSGARASTDAMGVARFNQLTLSAEGTGYQLEFTAQIDGIAPALSSTFDLSASQATVVGRYLVYNDSSYDGNDPAAGSEDDAAIATSKSALLPGETGGFANISNYARGINAIAIDISGMVGTPGVEDFQLRVGNSVTTNQWKPAPAPLSVNVRAGAGVNGSDRVTIVFDNRSITGQWLEVVVKNTQNTGLSQADRFYFGSAPGETGNSTTDNLVNATDLRRVVQGGSYDQTGKGVEEVYDFNKDGSVNFDDYIVALANGTTGENQLHLFTAP